MGSGQSRSKKSQSWSQEGNLEPGGLNNSHLSQNSSKKNEDGDDDDDDDEDKKKKNKPLPADCPNIPEEEEDEDEEEDEEEAIQAKQDEGVFITDFKVNAKVRTLFPPGTNTVPNLILL